MAAGDLPVYDASSGALLRTFDVPRRRIPRSDFLNDLIVTH